MNVLLSIKPRYVKEIIAGRKKYEFRKAIYKMPDVNSIYIYSTAPEKQIVAKFTPSQVFSDTPENLWKKFKKNAGISKKEFFEYFANKASGYAIAIDALHVFDHPINPNDVLEKFTAPQSFTYVQEFLKNQTISIESNRA